MKKYPIYENRTYCNGYYYMVTEDVKKSDFIKLCNILNDKLSHECTFEPEPITEGGIVYKFKNNDNYYKTMRIYIGPRLFYCDRKKGYIYNSYPQIINTVMEDWKDSDDILVPGGVLIGTFLKAFHGAPLYTQKELEIWNECFAEIGMIKKGKRKISNKRLNVSCYIGFKENEKISYL